MARLNLPKFGNWETEEAVPYTTYFENARRASSSEKVNINNSPDIHNLISLKVAEAARMKRECKVSQEDGEMQRPFGSPSRHDGGHKASGVSIPQQPTGVSTDAPKKAARRSGGGFHSADHSPLHPHSQAKIDTKESAGTHGLAPSTPGRSRLRSVPRGSETPDRGASVPKFGQWDETDPSSADGFSYIFNKVKEERHGSGGNTSATATDTHRGQKRYGGNYSKGCCCFPWGGN